MGEVKPVSFRIDTETAEKFKEIAEKNGFTQTQTLENLVRVFEIQTAKMYLPDRQKEIEEFELHTKRSLEIYLNALEVNKNTELYIRHEYNKQLQSKDDTIIDLQDKLKESKEEQLILKKDSEIINEVVVGYESKLLTLEDKNITLSQLIAEYKDKNDTLSGLLTEHKQYKTTVEEIKTSLENEITARKESEFKVREAEYTNSELTKESKVLAQSIDLLNEQHLQFINTIKERAELDKQKEILDLQVECQKLINQLHQEYHVKVKQLLQEQEALSLKANKKTPSSNVGKATK